MKAKRIVQQDSPGGSTVLGVCHALAADVVSSRGRTCTSCSDCFISKGVGGLVLMGLLNMCAILASQEERAEAYCMDCKRALCTLRESDQAKIHQQYTVRPLRVLYRAIGTITPPSHLACFWTKSLGGLTQAVGYDNRYLQTYGPFWSRMPELYKSPPPPSHPPTLPSPAPPFS